MDNRDELAGIFNSSFPMGLLDLQQPTLIKQFEKLFTRYTAEKWSEPPHDGFIRYRDDKRESICNFAHYPGLGFHVSFSISDRVTLASLGEWRSLSDKSKFKYFVDYHSDCPVPVGGFISPLETFKYLEAYVSDPINLPPVVDGVNPLIESKLSQSHPEHGGEDLPEGIADCYKFNSESKLLSPVYPLGTPEAERTHAAVPLN